FLEKAPKLSKQVSSVKWLTDWLEQNPTARAQINMVDGISFTDKAHGQLMLDFRKHRPNLAKEVEPQLKDSVLVTINEGRRQYSRWIVLPDGRMLLWHASGLPVVKWTEHDLPESWS